MLYISLSIVFMHYEYRRMVCAVPGSAGFPTRQVGEEKLSTITQPTTALPCCLTTKHSHALSPKGSSSNISDMCKLLHCGNNSLLFGDEHNSTFTLNFQPNLPPGLISLANTGLKFSVCCEAKLGIQESFPLVLAGKSCSSFTDSIHEKRKEKGKAWASFSGKQSCSIPSGQCSPDQERYAILTTGTFIFSSRSTVAKINSPQDRGKKSY